MAIRAIQPTKIIKDETIEPPAIKEVVKLKFAL